MSKNITSLRKSIKQVDFEILELIKKRIDLAKQIGEYKIDHDIAVRNYQVENQVIKRAKKNAKKLGLPTDLAKELAEILILEAVSVQTLDRRETPQSSVSHNCLIIGGEGKMGSWLTRFLKTSGHRTDTVDKTKDADYNELPPNLDDYSIILIATPMDQIGKIIEELINKQSSAIIADIGSLKSPFEEIILHGVDNGMKITSFHPLFGPEVKTLAGRNIVFCSAGNKEADNIIKELFTDTAANIVEVDFKDHDKYMVYTLGLAHASNLVFGKMLINSGIKYNDIMDFAGTTFLKQLETTKEVYSENPELYYQIQNYNKNKDQMYKDFEQAVSEIGKISNHNDCGDFVELMENGQKYFGSDKL